MHSVQPGICRLQHGRGQLGRPRAKGSELPDFSYTSTMHKLSSINHLTKPKDSFWWDSKTRIPNDSPHLESQEKCGRNVIISFDCVPTCQLLWVDASWCKQSTEHKIQIIHLTLYPRPKKIGYLGKNISLIVFLANVLLLSGYIYSWHYEQVMVRPFQWAIYSPGKRQSWCYMHALFQATQNHLENYYYYSQNAPPMWGINPLPQHVSITCSSSNKHVKAEVSPESK